MAGLIGGLVGGVGSAVGGIEEGNAAQTAANAQQQLNQQDIAGLQALLNSYNQEYAPQIPTAAADIGAEGAGAGSQANQLASLFQQAGVDPAIISQITGVNADQLAQTATKYLSTPGATQTGQIGSNVVQQLMSPSTALSAATPGLSSFYGNEMTQGINPQFAENAANQLQQSYNQAKSDLEAHRQPGQNVGAQEKNMFDQLLSSQTNLGSQLAGESQQFANQGAAGVAGTAANLDTQTQQRLISALQSAGVIDQQTASNLLSAANLGSSTQQTQLSNIGNAASSSQNVIDQLMNFINSGRSTVLPGLAQLGQLGQQYGTTAANLGAAAGQSFSNAATGIGNAMAGSSPDFSSNAALAIPSYQPTLQTVNVPTGSTAGL